MNKQLVTTLTLFLLVAFTSVSSIAETTRTTVTNTQENPSNEVTPPVSSTETITTTTTTVNHPEEDVKIVGMVYDKFAKDSALDGTSLNVTCANGVVTINGNVTMTSQQQAAVSDAKSIAGVKEVNSSINVTTNQIKTKQPKTPNY